MDKLIICTTAIPRGDFHALSLGAIYQHWGAALDRYHTRHFIHLDDPAALRDRFSVEDTRAALEELVHRRASLTVLRSETPSFLGAYKRLMKAACKVGLRSPTTWIWWLEDDWAPTEGGCDFLRIMEFFQGIPRVAMALAGDAHLGSFRGGPLMSVGYFEACFDLESLGVANDTCDPEKQYQRWLSGMNLANGHQRIHRALDFDDAAQGVVQILHLHLQKPGAMDRALDARSVRRTAAFHERSGRFHPQLTFQTYVVASQTEDLTAKENVLRMSKVNPWAADFPASVHALPEVEADALRRIFDDDAITYVVLHPPVVQDIGRSFNKKHCLQKWGRMEDATTYIPQKTETVKERTPIAIATTAINRPELHDDVLPGWIEWLSGLDPRRFAVRWFIHIDMVHPLEPSWEETRDNLRRLIGGSFNVEFLPHPQVGGNFLKACQRLSTHVVEYLSAFPSASGARVIWLEDDWKLNAKTSIPPQDLIDRYGTPRSHINLSYIRNNYIWALAPSIISYDLFRDLHHEAWMHQETFVDPEHCVGLHWRKRFGDPEALTNLTVINRHVADDFFAQGFLQAPNAFYTRHGSAPEPSWNLGRYVTHEDFARRFGAQDVFVRITGSFCLGGAGYSRDFMARKCLVKQRGTAAAQKFYR